MASITLVINSPKDTSTLVKSGQKREDLKRVANLINGIAAGKLPGKVVASVSSSDAVAASATITCASVLAADTVTIAGIVLTASATPSGIAQFDQSGSDSADAASLAAIINAHTTLGLYVQASASSNVVTVTCSVPGKIGNLVTLVSSNGTRLAVTGSGFLANGAGGAGSAPITMRG